MEDRWLSIASFCLFVAADIFIVLTVIKYYENEPKIK